jgi:ABC-type antimicrobial peptide transport system permease subunit
LFGTAASYFVRFIYAYWVKKEMPMKYIVKAGICVVLVVVLSALIPLLN